MLKCIVYKREYYVVSESNSRHVDRGYRDDYIRFEWDTGYLDMRMKDWERLNNEKKDVILKLGRR